MNSYVFTFIQLVLCKIYFHEMIVHSFMIYSLVETFRTHGASTTARKVSQI